MTTQPSSPLPATSFASREPFVRDIHGQGVVENHGFANEKAGWHDDKMGSWQGLTYLKDEEGKCKELATLFGLEHPRSKLMRSTNVSALVLVLSRNHLFSILIFLIFTTPVTFLIVERKRTSRQLIYVTRTVTCTL
jgi:hypothetical protein